MAWTSKFSGLPTQTDLPTGSDAYGAGVFTIDTFTGSDRKFNDSPSSQSPIAYETLASIGASISNILRVTTRWTGWPAGGEVLPCSIGPVLYEAANRVDALTAFFDHDDSGGSGYKDAYAYENSATGLQVGGGSVGYGPSAFIPFQARIYWNGTGSAFIIPDAGFGSWSVAAGTYSVWHSLDDGTTWVRLGDRAIAGSIVPDRVGAFVWASGVIPITGTDTLTLGNLEVMEDTGALAPVVGSQRPAPGDTEAPPYQPAYLEVTDANGNLVAASVIIKYNGKVAWSGDAAQEGFSVVKSAITNGFSYAITPHVLPPRGSNVSINVYADDGTLSVTEDYVFGIGVRSFVLRFDDFSDSTLDPDLVVISGNGVVTEPAGTELKLDCPDSTNCDWWASIDNAPKAYFPFETWMRRGGVFQLENKLSGFDESAANVAAGGGPMLYQNSQNVYFALFYDYVNDIRFERIVANAASGRWNSADGQVHPNTTPHLYRFVWNTSGQPFLFDDGSVLQDGEITMFYSVNGGTSWVRAYTEVMAIAANDFIGFGTWMKKWNAGAYNAQSYIDYLELRELLPIPELTEEIDPQAQLEISAKVEKNAAGPLIHGADYSAGMRLPGPPLQPVGSLGPFDDGQLEIEALGEVRDLLAPGTKLLPSDPQRDGQLEIEAVGVLSVLTTYRTTTNDFNGHPHFIGERVKVAFYYDAAKEAGPWTNPTDPSFTGYGKDGHYYVAGVDQLTFAPWYSEVESDDRGPRQDFPDKALICYTCSTSSETPQEVVIFDLDNFPVTLNVWMRFRFGPSGGNYTMMGRINQKPADLEMANGILSVVTTEGDYRGGLHLINFTQSGKDCGHYIRSNGHFVWQPATEIAGRNLTGASQWNTPGVTVSLLTDSESIYSVSMRAAGDKTWVAIGGEDFGPNMYRIGTYPEWRTQATGDVGDANIGDIRNMIFDQDGYVWYARENILFRGIPADYEEGVLSIDLREPNPRRRGGAPEWVVLGHDIIDLVAVADWIFLATEVGVYRVHRGTMVAKLAYTIVDGGGGGKDDIPPQGELIAGIEAEVRAITGHTFQSAHYIYVATGGGVTVIRLLDDFAVDARVYPDLHFWGAWFNVASLT